MKTGKREKSIIAPVLALMMVLGSVSAPADDSITQNVIYDAGGNIIENAGSEYTYEGDSSSVLSIAVEGGDTNLTIYGEIKSSDDYGAGDALAAEAGNNGKAIVTANEVKQEKEEGANSAVSVNVYDGGNAEVTTGDIYSTATGVEVVNDTGTVTAKTDAINSEDKGLEILNTDGNTTFTEIGDIRVNGSAGIDVENYAGGVVTIAKTGTISNSRTGVTVYNAGGTVTATTETIKATGNGISIDNQPRGDTGGDWNDGAAVPAADGDENISPDGLTRVTVRGGIFIEGETSGTGVKIYELEEDIRDKIIVNGETNVDMVNDANGILVWTLGNAAIDANDNTTVRGNWATGEYLQAIEKNAESEETIRTSVKGKLDVTGEVSAVGIKIHADGNKIIESEVTDDLTVTATREDAFAVGVDLSVGNSTDATITLGGNLTVQESKDATAIKMSENRSYAEDNIKAEVTATGNVTSSGNGIILKGKERETEAVDASTITVKEDELYHKADRKYRRVDGDDVIYYEVNEAGEVVKAEKLISVDSEKERTFSVEIGNDEDGGNLTAEENAMIIELENEQSRMDVLVNGTVDGKTNSVLLSTDTIEDNLTLTVWEITENEHGNLVEKIEKYDDNGEAVTGVDTEAEEKIQYIIKVEQPTEGGTLIATDKDGKTLAKSHDYDVAREDERVLVKVNVAKGYVLNGAYNGKNEKIMLLTDADGNYYIDVPKGGGVYLSAELAITPEEKKEKKEKKEEENEIEKKVEAKTEAKTKDRTDTDTKTGSTDETGRVAIVQVKVVNDGTVVRDGVVLKASVEEGNETDYTRNVKKEIQDWLADGKDLLGYLPTEILEKLPKDYGKLIAMKTLILVNYDESMGTMTFMLPFSEKFTQGEKVSIALTAPDGEKKQWFYAEGEGQADGTLLVKIDVAILKPLIAKTFVALAIGRK